MRLFRYFCLAAGLISSFISAEEMDPSPSFDDGEDDSLFKDLALVEKIDKKIQDALPIYYNYSLMAGYFTMPSARMNIAGMVAAGGGRLPPYDIYGVNIQVLDRIELSGNYCVYTGVTEANFGKEGFGDDAERIGNIKFGILTPFEECPWLPYLSIGAEDFIGTKRFNAQYIVATQTWLEGNLEATLGWGRGRMKGFFGGVSWTPFRKRDSFFRNLSLIVEYDDNNYKKHPHEHPAGRKVKTPINGGISFLAWDTLQLTVNSIRGEKVAGSASLRVPLGSTKGLFPKVDDAKIYKTPIVTEPLGHSRPEVDFAHELAYALGDQGLDLYVAYLFYDQEGKKQLWIKVVNNRYRLNEVVKERVESILAALTPSDIEAVTVVVEADALPCQAYYYRTQDLYRYRLGLIGRFELETVSPIQEAPPAPSEYESTLLFQRKKPIWTFTVRPRLITFFGSTHGKFKYNLGMVASPEGYVFNQVYYKTLVSYSALSSMKGLSGVDRLNPSHLYVVRTDSMKYFQSNTYHMEQAFLQRSWNLRKGFFYRLATGYFEAAYGGLATEFLYYPVSSSLALGISGAAVWKRHYNGIGFVHEVLKYDGTKTEKKPFLGVQYFFHIYYDYKPLQVDCKIAVGQFLAKDVGARFEVGRYFKSGMRFSLWYSLTNANEKLNGHTYHDKGFAFLLPLDMFMKQSSRNYIGYAMSAWLRDQAATADTGKQLYPTLREERIHL